MKVPKLHLSRKLVLIVGGVLVLCGGTGGAAVYIGADTLLGPSYAELNGLECTEVQTVEIRKKDRFWIRKYVTTSEPGDGLTRVKTALRIAKVVQEAKKADLVQVVVLDPNGPKERGLMRGRAVGADVIFVPDPTRVPEAATARMLTARYADGPPAANGEFFGQKIDMVEDDIQALLAKLDDSTDCITPEVVVPEGEGHGDSGGHGKADAHGKKSEGHGDSGGHGDAGGHGEAPAEGHGEADAHGEAPADGHGEAPAGEHGAETPVADHGGESKGWMASLMGMVGLGGDDAPAEGHGGAADAGHGEAPADGHGDPAAADHGDGEGHAAPAEDSAGLPTDGHGAEPAAHGEASGDHAKAPESGAVSEHGDAAQAGASDHASAPEQDGGDHGSADGHAGAANGEEVAAPAVHETEVPVVETPVDAATGHDAAVPEEASHEAASAEAPSEDGGWFSSLKSMVGLGGTDEPAAAADKAAPAETSGEAGAGGADHGAAWLEKMRSQPIEPESGVAAQPAASEQHGSAADHGTGTQAASAEHAAEGSIAPAEDEGVLPPKKVLPVEEAKAGH